MVALHVLFVIAGILLVLATWQSIIVTIILPRRTRNWIAVTGWVATYYVLTALAQRARDPARKDAILALLGPVNIVGLLGTWMLLFGVGFGFVMWGTEAASFWDSLDLAGSSIFTLGFATGKTPFSHFLTDLAAASGMIVVGLQIGYLPTIYGAYSQREALVTLTSMRCSEGNGVLTGASVLRNHPLPASADLLRSLFASWEASAAAIIESHTNYPWLIAFRSPRASESWVTSMLAILDAISLLQAIGPSSLPLEAEHCRFACTTTFRSLSEMLRPRETFPRHRDALSYEAFASAVEGAIAPALVERDVEDAWPIFRAARAGYESYALELAAYMWLPIPAKAWLRPVAT